MTARPVRRLAAMAVAAVLLAATVLAVAPAGVASAQTLYRYWAFFHRTDGGWAASNRGAATSYPKDGAVEGWRYQVAADGGGKAPRTSISFAAVCAGVPVKAGRKRVAFVFDYGTRADARAGQTPPPLRAGCASGRPGASAQELQGSIARVRLRGDGLLCAFDGYPSTGCVDTVPAGPPSPAPTPTRPAPTRPGPTRPAPTRWPTATPTRPAPTRPPSTRRPTAAPTGRASAPPTRRATPRPTRRPAELPNAGSRTSPGAPGPGAPSRPPAPRSGPDQPLPSGAAGSTDTAAGPGVAPSRPAGVARTPGTAAPPRTTGPTTGVRTPFPPAPTTPGAAGGTEDDAAGPPLLTGATRPEDGTHSTVPTVVGLGLLACLGVATAVVTVRRRIRPEDR